MKYYSYLCVLKIRMTSRVRVENETEWDIVQNLYFVLGYSWFTRGKVLRTYYDKYNTLSMWSDGDIGVSLEEFLDYIEDNDIRYDG